MSAGAADLGDGQDEEHGAPDDTTPGLMLACEAWRRRPVLLGVSLAAVLAATMVLVGPVAALPAYLVLAVAGVTLAAVDLRTYRLPDVLVGPTGGAVLVLLGVAAAVEGAGWSFLRAVAAAGVCFALFLVLAIVNPAGLGLGDVKLAPVLGLALGWVSWTTVLFGILAAFLAFSLVGVVLMALRRARGSTELPFGPFLLLGVLVALVPGVPN